MKHNCFPYFSFWHHVLFSSSSRPPFLRHLARTQLCGRVGRARSARAASWASLGPGNEPSCCFPWFCPRACPGLHWCEPGSRTAAAAADAPAPFTGPAGGLRPRAAPVPSRSRWSPENALPPQPLPPLPAASAGCGPPLLSSVPRASCQCL